MNDLLNRSRTILTSSVWYLLAAQVIVQSAITEFGDDIPAVAQYGGQVVALLIGAVAVIRRVTPVSAEGRGLIG